MVPIEYDDWDGPHACSFCGARSNTDWTICLACRESFKNEEEWLEHRFAPGAYNCPLDPLVQLNPQTPLVLKGATKGSGTPVRPGIQKAIGGQKLTIGGTCKSGKHTLTARNLYVSPRGVATCKDCRKGGRRDNR